MKVGEILETINTEKYWSEMNKEEKMRAYNVAIKSGDVKDTFNGFSKSMYSAIFNPKTGELIEL